MGTYCYWFSAPWSCWVTLRAASHERGGVGQDQSQAQVPCRGRLRQEGGEFVRPGFLEKASKKLEVDKTISKVSQPSSSGPSAKRSKYTRDNSDLRSFLAKGAPARYGSGKFQRRQPYQPPAKFRSQKYYQPRSV